MTLSVCVLDLARQSTVIGMTSSVRVLDLARQSTVSGMTLSVRVLDLACVGSQSQTEAVRFRTGTETHKGGGAIKWGGGGGGGSTGQFCDFDNKSPSKP